MASQASRNDIKNPFGFKLVSERPEPVPRSEGLIRVGLATGGGSYYAALTDPVTRKCYILKAEINQANPKKDILYKEIEDFKEWNVASIFFRKVGVFELFYNGSNWVFPRKPNPDKKSGKDVIPPWFKDRFIKL